MKILKYQKKNNGRYLLQLENGIEVETYEDLILKYDLLIKKNISDIDLANIKEENKTYALYFEAIRYLKTKPRSIHELKEHFQKAGYEANLIEDVVKKLKQQGYLDDYKYAISFVHDKIFTTQSGPLKILEGLHTLEICDEDKEKLLQEFSKEKERERVEKLILKLMRSNHSKSNYMLKKKIQNYLINQGYHSEIIHEKMALVDQDEKEAYQKEYQKLYRKLSRKYEGKELDYQIRAKLFQKGFRGNIDD